MMVEPGRNERIAIAVAFAASVALHASALLAPRLPHPEHPHEEPLPLTVELRPPPVAPEADRLRRIAEPEPEKPAQPPRMAPPKSRAEPPPPPKPPPKVAALAPPVPPVSTPAPSSEAPPAPASPAPAAAPSTASSEARPQGEPERRASAPSAPVTAPSLNAAYLRNPPPRYPASARRNGEEGTVMLRVAVTAGGAASRVDLERSSGYAALDEAALAAVKNWRFVPAQRGGEPVDAVVVVPVVFRLNEGG
jgi:protein TonB